MKLLVVTSTGIRHHYFASFLGKSFDLVGIVSEKKQFHPDKVHKTPDEEMVLAQWFDMRAKAEETYFRSAADSFREDYREKILEIEPGAINNDELIGQLSELKPEVIAVFGSSLLKEKFISVFQDIPIINMHLGLSPYYRGSGTNFWPFFNKEIEYVGVTIHFIDLGIDSGDIICQGRPRIEKEDNPHTIGCKTIQVGASLMQLAIEKSKNGTIKSNKQDHSLGKLYKRKDFAPLHVVKVMEYLSEGLIENYVHNPINVEIVE